MPARAHVLVVEDEPALAQLCTLRLTAAGFLVTSVATGEDALDVAATQELAVVLLDIGLAGRLDGIDVCRARRAREDWTPVILVTARDEEADRVLGLELGADDYVTKPYSPRELVARVRAQVRRTEVRANRPAGRVTVGDVLVDLQAHEVRVRDEQVPLTPTEFALLAHLLSRPRRMFTRAELLEQVWGYPGTDASRTVDTHVAQLRAKLGADCPIRTVRGLGYGTVLAP